MAYTTTVKVVEGTQVLKDGHLYMGGQTFKCSTDEAQELLDQGLVHPFHSSSKKGTAKNK
jgi:hypothetical protein